MTRALRIAAFLAVLALGAAACGSDADPSGARAEGGDEQPGASASVGAGARAELPGGDAGASAGASAAAEIVAPSPPPPGEASESTPPAAGTYRFRQEGQTKAGTFTLSPDPEGTLEIAPATVAKGGLRQRHARKISSNRSQTQIYLFTDDALLLEETTTGFGPQEQTCRTEKPLRVLVLPLKAGASWSDKGACNGGDISFTAKVQRAEKRTIGGTTLDTFVVHHTFVFTADGAKQTTEVDTWISPVYRLGVRSVVRSEGSAQGVAFSDELTEELISLTPA